MSFVFVAGCLLCVSREETVRGELCSNGNRKHVVMRKLLNTLYVFTEDAYLALEGKNVVVWRSDEQLGRVPLHTLEGILIFSYKGASPALMGACANSGIQLSFFTPHGRYLAGVHGRQRGNVLLRREQHSIASDCDRSLAISRNFIIGKIYNGRWVIERCLRDHSLRVDCDRLRICSAHLKSSINSAADANSIDALRGIEGDAAKEYFSAFDQLILRDKEIFKFAGRSRKPALDAVNAMLSLFYTVLASDCAAALEGVGLDPYVGFMHSDRPGRPSLALDLMEELRHVFVDRFVVSAINNRLVDTDSFIQRESGEVRLTDDARKRLFEAWQKKKKDSIVHPFLREKMVWGLVPHVQALLLARHIRGDLDGYPPLLWK